MGFSSAYDMASQATMDQALTWHLQANHYPPVPVAMVPACKEAIQAIVEEDENRVISLPTGVTYRGMPVAEAWRIAEQHHLDPFIIAIWESSE